MGFCYNCGEEIVAPVHRSTVCSSCGKDVKVCLNCRFYSPGVHWDCRETIPEPVKEKDRANFCGYFSLADTPPSGGHSESKEKKNKAKKAFDDLFS